MEIAITQGSLKTHYKDTLYRCNFIKEGEDTLVQCLCSHVHMTVLSWTMVSVYNTKEVFLWVLRCIITIYRAYFILAVKAV